MNTRVWPFLLSLAFAVSLRGQVYADLEDRVLQALGVKDTLYEDLATGLIVEGRVFRGQWVDTLHLYSPSEYQEQRFQEILQDLVAQAFSESLRATSERAGGGLIPDIEIPMRLPSQIGFLGQGGRLRIEGQQDITLGMRKTSILGLPEMEGSRSSAIPNLEMDQNLRVKLTGTVGDKIHVLVDHDSKRENKMKNTIKLTYKGDEDDIIQLIETGDTDFNIPGVSTGLSGNRKGLFGVKFAGQLGPVDFQAVLAREQAEKETRHFSPNAEVRQDTLYAREYVGYRFFWLGDTSHIARGPNNQPLLEVFLDDGNAANNQNALPGIAIFYDLNSHQPDSFYTENGNFTYLQLGIDYDFYTLGGSNVLMFHNSLDPRLHLVGVRYITAAGDTVGNFGDTTYLFLKMLKPKGYHDTLSLRPQRPSSADTAALIYYAQSVLWLMMLKNVYYVGTGVTPTSIQIYHLGSDNRILPTDANGKTFLELLGLDANGDNKVDAQRVLDLNNGYLVFPEPYPFASGALTDPDTAMYRSPVSSLEGNEGTTYFITIETTSRSSVITLGSDPIVEGSEVVRWRGQTLRRGVDYTIDYEASTITILNQDVLNDPTASLEITYDYAPFFSQSQKSLIASYFESNWSQNFKIHGSFLYRSVSTVDQRPQLGSVPTRDFMGSLGWNLQQSLPFLTRWVDRLPLISTDQPSQITWSGSLDRNYSVLSTLGYAYLDDMEGNRQSQDIPTYRSRWIYGSIPTGLDGDVYDTTNYARRIIWASPQDWVRKGDVFPNARPEEADDPQEVLLLIVEPPAPGTPHAWASLNHLFSSAGFNLSNYDYLEVYVHGQGAKLHLDLGYKIPERSVWRNAAGAIRGITDYDTIRIVQGTDTTYQLVPKVHNEDRDGDNQVSPSEDVGLDLVAGDDGQWHPGSADDGNDDYHYTPGSRDFSRVNGTEGNRQLDTDDLDKNGTLETKNAYFSFTLDLDDPNAPGLEYVNPQTGWKYFRIPLRDPDFYRQVGDEATWENIRYVRLWLSDFERTDTVLIAQMSVTGSKWIGRGVHTASPENPVQEDERFSVATVGVLETPGYTSPPGLRLRRDPTTGQLENEHSLALVAENLRPGHFAYAERALFRKQDFLDYRTLRFWVRPRPGSPLPYPTVFLRVGLDSTNFYEYRFKLFSADWQEVVVPLDSLTQFKKQVLDTAAAPPRQVVSNGRFGFRGTPSLANIRMYQVGILNDLATRVSVEIWVDELRLGDPLNGGGMALNSRFQLNLAGITDFNLNFTRQEPNFRPPGQQQSARRDLTQYNLNTTLYLHTFLPQSWGITLPFSYTNEFRNELPVYQPNSDVRLHPGQRREVATRLRKETYHITFRKTGGTHWFPRLFLAPFYADFSHQFRRQRTPDRSLLHTENRATLRYTYSPSLQPLQLLGLRIGYFPTQIHLESQYVHRLHRDSTLTTQTLTETEDHYFQNQFSTSFQPLQSLAVSYNQSTTNDRTLPSGNFFGKEIGRSEGLSLSYSLSLLGLLTPSITWNTNYTEDRSPEVQIDTLNREIRNLNRNITTTVNLTVDPLRFWNRMKDWGRHLSVLWHRPSRSAKKPSAPADTGRAPSPAPPDTSGDPPEAPPSSPPDPPAEPQDTLSTSRPDSLQQPGGETQPAPRPHRTLPFRPVLRFAGQLLRGLFSPQSFQLTTTDQHLIYSAFGRPPPAFRLGFQPNPQVTYLDTARSTRTHTVQVNQNSTLPLPGLNLSYGTSYNLTQNYTYQRNYYTENFTLPNLTLGLPSFYQWVPFLKKFATSASLSLTYTHTLSNQGDIGGALLQRTSGESYGPNLTLQLKGGTQATLQMNRHWQKTLAFQQYGAGAQTSVSTDFSLRLNHSLRRPGGIRLPFGRGVIKLRSEIRNNLELHYTDSKQINYGVVQSDQGTFTLTLSSQYNFSRNITGQAQFNLRNVKDRKTELTTREWNFQLSASFKF